MFVLVVWVFIQLIHTVKDGGPDIIQVRYSFSTSTGREYLDGTSTIPDSNCPITATSSGCKG